MKLGKLPPRIDPRTFRLEKYLRKTLPPPPSAIGWYDRSWKWDMLLNDSLGCCVPTAMAHMIQQWTAYTRNPVVPTDAEVLKAYQDIGGYVPGDPSTDNGCVMLDALNYWRKTGFDGHKILGYAALNLRDHVQVMQAIWLFGNVFTGVALPVSAQGQTSWRVPVGGAVGAGLPGSWGGHCIPQLSAGSKAKKLSTWAQVYDMDWAFDDLYVDEGYAVFAPEWVQSSMAVNHVDMQALYADLAAL